MHLTLCAHRTHSSVSTALSLNLFLPPLTTTTKSSNIGPVPNNSCSFSQPTSLAWLKHSSSSLFVHPLHLWCVDNLQQLQEQTIFVHKTQEAGATNGSVSPVENNPFTNHSCPQLLGVGLDLKRKLGNIFHYHTTPLPASYCFQLLANTHLLV